MTNNFAKIVKVIDEFRIVINQGTEDGISPGDRFLVLEVGEELFDPDSGESLGMLEIVKGRGRVTYVQEKLATIRSTESERVAKRNMYSIALGTEYETREVPFENPKLEDIARPLD